MDSTLQIFNAADGVQISAESWGDPTHPAIIFSHGGGQTRHSWGGTAKALAQQGWYTLVYDHRGHGDSGWSEDGHYKIDQFSSDLRLIAEHFSHPPAVVGASLGGFSALLCAGELGLPLFASVTLVDVTPNLNPEGVKNIHQFMISHMEQGFDSLEHAGRVVAEYTGRPERDDYSGLGKNLRMRDGRWYWHWDPNIFTMAQGARPNHGRMIEAVKNIKVPMQLIRGRLSDVVTQQQVDEFLKIVPHAEYVDVEDARHMVAGDRNDIFTEAVQGFLQRQHPSGQRY